MGDLYGKLEQHPVLSQSTLLPKDQNNIQMLPNSERTRTILAGAK
jgi:hypothetical protein